jgi:hypothetical protein
VSGSSPLRVNADRLWSRHMALARIGMVEETGNCRLALSDEDATARALFADWCDRAGLGLRSDPAGNMFAPPWTASLGQLGQSWSKPVLYFPKDHFAGNRTTYVGE